jgi:hypothetical protein
MLRSWYKIIFLFLAIAPFFLKAQTKEAGLLLPTVDSLRYTNEYCCILSPKNGFKLYNAPNGKVVGTLQLEIRENDNQSPYFIYLTTTEDKEQLATDNFKLIGNEIYAIPFYEKRNSFVRILVDKGNYWIAEKELNKIHFTAKSWINFLLEENEKVLGYYAKAPGLRIRKEPTTSSDLVEAIRGDLFEIKLSNEIKGQWCKVSVTKYKEHPCETDLEDKDNIERIIEGWMKIIDDNGDSNLWYYAKGC